MDPGLPAMVATSQPNPGLSSADRTCLNVLSDHATISPFEEPLSGGQATKLVRWQLKMCTVTAGAVQKRQQAQ